MLIIWARRPLSFTSEINVICFSIFSLRSVFMARLRRYNMYIIIRAASAVSSHYARLACMLHPPPPPSRPSLSRWHTRHASMATKPAFHFSFRKNTQCVILFESTRFLCMHTARLLHHHSYEWVNERIEANGKKCRDEYNAGLFVCCCGRDAIFFSHFSFFLQMQKIKCEPTNHLELAMVTVVTIAVVMWFS